MLCDMVNNLIQITEMFPANHKMVDNYLPAANSQTNTNPNLKTMSPKLLYRKKGLNITKYHKIMRNQGIK